VISSKINDSGGHQVGIILKNWRSSSGIAASEDLVWLWDEPFALTSPSLDD
jgi:hypothetical protein